MVLVHDLLALLFLDHDEAAHGRGHSGAKLLIPWYSGSRRRRRGRVKIHLSIAYPVTYFLN
jgi:hypothetical protein